MNDTKTKQLGMLTLLLGVALFVMGQTYNTQVQSTLVQYRGGSVLTFDSSVKFRDEDTNWSFGWQHLRRLANDRSGSASNLTANLVTNSFGVTYPSVPQVICSCATNCSVISKTTSNAVFWAASTNQVIDWVATAF